MKVTDFFENRDGEIVLTLSGAKSPISVVLNEEHTLKLYRENTILNTFVCSPSELSALCVGWLHTEGYIADALEIPPGGHIATVYGATEAPVSAEKLCQDYNMSVSTGEMLKLFAAASDKHARSHGIHECVIKGDGWWVSGTDIGRHNAIDKAVGTAILAGYDISGATMFSSGRINTQTVKKAVRCKVGCLMSKAVITHDALKLARELGLKVLFSVKEDSYISI